MEQAAQIAAPHIDVEIGGRNATAAPTCNRSIADALARNGRNIIVGFTEPEVVAKRWSACSLTQLKKYIIL